MANRTPDNETRQTEALEAIAKNSEELVRVINEIWDRFLALRGEG